MALTKVRGSGIDADGQEIILDADGDTSITADTDDQIDFKTGGSDRVTIDSSGNLMVGKTSTDASSVGFEARASGFNAFTRDGSQPLEVRRLTNDGDLVSLRIGASEVGSIGGISGDIYAGTGDTRLRYNDGGDDIRPASGSGLARDDAIDLGDSAARFDDIFATNGTIQTSDRNEKQDIADSDLGLDFVNRLAPKSYIFNGKTRTHYGLIAQDVETVLSDINKETSEFAGFIKEDISENQDGSQYRYGLRYTEFVGILIKALQEADDKIDALTAKVTALENA